MFVTSGGQEEDEVSIASSGSMHGESAGQHTHRNVRSHRCDPHAREPREASW